VGVKVQEVTWIKFENVTIANFTGAGSIGLLLANVSNWTEQGDYDHVNLDFNTIGMAFQDNHAGNTGAPSFAYTRIRDMVITVPPSGVGMKLQNDANMNGCDIEVSFFGGSSSTLLQLLSTSNIIGSRIKLTGEKSAGATSITGVSTAAGTVLQTQLWEFWNSDQITDSLSGTSIYYASTPVPGYTSIFTAANGYQVQANGNNFSGTFDVHNITNFRTWTLPDASGNVTLDSATQNLTNKTFGIAGASSGVLTLAGSTSDSCTITAPAVAGTVTNPIAFSNSINLNGASCVYQTNGVAGVSHASSDYTAFTFNGGIVTALTASSDERLKTDIKPFAYGLDAILAIDPVSYHWNELGHKHGGCNTDVEYAGFIAQNVQKAIPTAITGTEGDEKYLCLDTRAIISALVNSVKELKAEIELLKSK
jgi:hypothetical protein